MACTATLSGVRLCPLTPFCTALGLAIPCCPSPLPPCLSLPPYFSFWTLNGGWQQGSGMGLQGLRAHPSCPPTGLVLRSPWGLSPATSASLPTRPLCFPSQNFRLQDFLTCFLPRLGAGISPCRSSTDSCGGLILSGRFPWPLCPCPSPEHGLGCGCGSGIAPTRLWDGALTFLSSPGVVISPTGCSGTHQGLLLTKKPC